MKLSASRILSILFLITIFSGNLHADRYVQEEECCRPSCCYECSCNPLYCGAFDVQGQVGVAPIIWLNRGVVSIVSCTGTPGANALFQVAELPKYSTLFRVPWIVGGQVGYAASDNVRLYLEFDYLQARSKNTVALTSVNLSPNLTIAFDFAKYRLFEAYIGARYYFDRWCDRVSLFLGFKAGLTHHYAINSNFSITPPVPVASFTDVNTFRRHTAPSGGLNIGLDFCFCGCWSFVITGEMVASCGIKGNRNIAFGQPTAGCGSIGVQPALPAVAGVNNLLIGGVGTELRFPVTAAIRYSF